MNNNPCAIRPSLSETIEKTNTILSDVQSMQDALLERVFGRKLSCPAEKPVPGGVQEVVCKEPGIIDIAENNLRKAYDLKNELLDFLGRL